jgi:hypothetical protein
VEVVAMSGETTEQGLARFDHVIVGDNAGRTINQEATRFDAEPVRLTESEIDALDAYDRVLTRTRAGEKVIIEMIPDDPCRPAPIEIRDCEEGGW